MRQLRGDRELRAQMALAGGAAKGLSASPVDEASDLPLSGNLSHQASPEPSTQQIINLIISAANPSPLVVFDEICHTAGRWDDSTAETIRKRLDAVVILAATPLEQLGWIGEQDLGRVDEGSCVQKSAFKDATIARGSHIVAESPLSLDLGSEQHTEPAGRAWPRACNDLVTGKFS